MRPRLTAAVSAGLGGCGSGSQQPPLDPGLLLVPLPPNVRLHLLAASGAPPRTVMEITGHSQIKLTMEVYSHVLPEQIRETTSRLDALLGAS